MKLDEAKEILKKNGAKLMLKETEYSEDEITSTVDKIERAIYDFKQKGNDYFDVFVDDVYDAIAEYIDTSIEEDW